MVKLSVWDLMPSDCTSAMAEIKRRGQMEAAREVVLAEAQDIIMQATARCSMLDLACAVEIAAQRWLDRSELA